MRWIKRLFCKHEYKLDLDIVSLGFLEIYSVERCQKCDKVRLGEPYLGDRIHDV